MSNIPMMHVVALIVTAIYGLVSLVGGIIGYVKADSAKSLIAGGISGILLLLCAAGVSRLPVASLIVALIIALALAGRFGKVMFLDNGDKLGEFLGTGGGITAVVMILGGIVVIAVSILALTMESRPPSGT